MHMLNRNEMKQNMGKKVQLLFYFQFMDFRKTWAFTVLFKQEHYDFCDQINQFEIMNLCGENMSQKIKPENVWK